MSNIHKRKSWGNPILKKLRELNLHDKSFESIKVDFDLGKVELVLESYQEKDPDNYLLTKLEFTEIRKFNLSDSGDGFDESEISDFNYDQREEGNFITFEMMQVLNSLASWSISFEFGDLIIHE